MGFCPPSILGWVTEFCGTALPKCWNVQITAKARSNLQLAHPISQEEQQEEAEKELEELHPDPQILEQIKQQLSWQYSDAALTQIPAKLSVTQIGTRGKNRKLKLRRPDFVAKKGLGLQRKKGRLPIYLCSLRILNEQSRIYPKRLIGW